MNIYKKKPIREYFLLMPNRKTFLRQKKKKKKAVS